MLQTINMIQLLQFFKSNNIDDALIAGGTGVVEADFIQLNFETFV